MAQIRVWSLIELVKNFNSFCKIDFGQRELEIIIEERKE